MEQCIICLEEIKPGMITKKFSCDCKTKYHYCCFKKMVYKNENFFVECPLCRKKNTNVDYPTNNFKKNILLMLHPALSQNIKCCCKTKTGRKCRLKAGIMNYGYCHIHNNEILKENHYELFQKWLYYIFQTNYKWVSILYLLDFGKKIIIHKLNEKNKNYGIESILHYLYRYINVSDNCIISTHMERIYDYYNLEKPPQKWLRYCIDKNTII